MQILVLSFLSLRDGGGEGEEGRGGIGRKRTLLKFCDLKGMTFTSICMYLSYAYSENLKSFLECFFFFFLEKTCGVFKLNFSVGQTRKVEGRTLS